MLYPKNGIQTDSEKVQAIRKWPIPTNVTEVRSFLGFTNYYQIHQEICTGSQTIIQTNFGREHIQKVKFH